MFPDTAFRFISIDAPGPGGGHPPAEPRQVLEWPSDGGGGALADPNGLGGLETALARSGAKRVIWRLGPLSGEQFVTVLDGLAQLGPAASLALEVELAGAPPEPLAVDLSQTSLEVSTRGYETGKVMFADVFASYDLWFKARLSLERKRSDVGIHWAKLEKTVGIYLD